MAVGRIKIEAGKAAIWTGDADDLPFQTPLSYLSRVKFHSDLAYPKVVSTISTTLSLAAVSGVSSRVASYSVAAHSQAGIPWVLGLATVQGQPIGFAGSVCVQQPHNNSGVHQDYGQFLALGADATNVWLHEYAVLAWSPTSYHTLDAISIPLTIFVTDRLLT